MVKSIKINNLDLSLEKSRDIIEFLARKRNINNYEHMTNEELFILKKTPQNPPRLGKRKSNQILTTQKPLKVAKFEINHNLTLQRPPKFAKRKNLTLQKQQKTKNKEKAKLTNINKSNPKIKKE